ncbi:hypothetical protein NQZ68_035743 [Dissostichus eleginoides]|nr:hypothetical protein NQZ68_035743 [Dissostichus eleginoides]
MDRRYMWTAVLLPDPSGSHLILRRTPAPPSQSSSSPGSPGTAASGSTSSCSPFRAVCSSSSGSSPDSSPGSSPSSFSDLLHDSGGVSAQSGGGLGGSGGGDSVNLQRVTTPQRSPPVQRRKRMATHMGVHMSVDAHPSQEESTETGASETGASEQGPQSRDLRAGASEQGPQSRGL